MKQKLQSAPEAIQILKAEIISPSWTLSPTRHARCSEAMTLLNRYFNNRRYAKGIVAIARQLLLHLQEKNNPAAMDLLKELMAHTVTIFEASANVTAEKKICASCLQRFKGLRIKSEGRANQPATKTNSK